jgi:hypothetical protein
MRRHWTEWSVARLRFSAWRKAIDADEAFPDHAHPKYDAS